VTAVRSVVGLLLVAAVVTACSAQTEIATAEPASTSTAEPAEAPTGAAVPSLDLPRSESELAALLPVEIAGQPAFRLAMGGEQLIAGGAVVTIEPGFQDVLDSLGAQSEDVSFALSSGADAEGSTIVIMAFRVAKADTSQLQTAFQAFWSTPSQPIDWQPDSVGGKSVVAGSDADNPGNTISVYAVGDLIFYVSAPNQELAAELLSPLP